MLKIFGKTVVIVLSLHKNTLKANEISAIIHLKKIKNIMYLYLYRNNKMHQQKPNYPSFILSKHINFFIRNEFIDKSPIWWNILISILILAGTFFNVITREWTLLRSCMQFNAPWFQRFQEMNSNIAYFQNFSNFTTA